MGSSRSTGLASFLVALGPLFFIAIFASWGAAGLPQTDAGDPTRAIPFLRAHGALILAPTLNSLVMHLAVIVLALGLYAALHERSPFIAATGTALGIMWAILDITQSLIAYNAVLAAPTADPATIDVVTKGMQNAGHLGGGLWTLAVAATSVGVFDRAHRAFGVITGIVFALHPLVVPMNPGYFYLEFVLLPVWFAWTGLALVRGPAGRTVLATS